MTITQQPPTATATPTAAQRVVSAMWTLGKPATAKAIAEAAGVGYSTVSPILRNLLGTNQAVKTEGAGGQAEWQLTATLPTAPATATAATDVDTDEGGGDEDGGDDGSQLDSPDPATASEPIDLVGTNDGDEPDPDTGSDNDDGHVDEGLGGSETAGPADEDPAPEETDATAQAKARTYRKPEQARRPKGHLRAAVLAVLAEKPEQQFKVSEVCKAIDAANTDGTANKAGAGAVANALDKLVHNGDAVRVDDATVATFQCARAGA